MTDIKNYILFDFDGVLVDSMQSIMQAHVACGDDPNLESAYVRTIKFAKTKHMLLNESATPELMQKKVEWFNKFGPALKKIGIKYFDGFISEVRKINNAKIAVVTSAFDIYFKDFVSHIDLPFTHKLSFEDNASKVAKIRTVLSDWKIGENDFYYITDTLADYYELEDFMDKTKILGCAWGYLGAQVLASAMPSGQILHNFADIHKFFK